MTKAERASLYFAYLAEEGYRPEIDADGDVAFKAEGWSYVILIDETDDNYFALLCPNFWEIENEGELDSALVAANYATRTTKVAKIFVRSDNRNTSASIEMFFERPEDFETVFSRALSALRTGVRTFAEKMRGEHPL